MNYFVHREKDLKPDLHPYLWTPILHLNYFLFCKEVIFDIVRYAQFYNLENTLNKKNKTGENNSWSQTTYEDL